LPRLPGSTPGSASLSFISLQSAGPELECEKKVQFCTTIFKICTYSPGAGVR
jgi:hypothetical protein